MHTRPFLGISALAAQAFLGTALARVPEPQGQQAVARVTDEYIAPPPIVSNNQQAVLAKPSQESAHHDASHPNAGPEQIWSGRALELKTWSEETMRELGKIPQWKRAVMGAGLAGMYYGAWLGLLYIIGRSNKKGS